MDSRHRSSNVVFMSRYMYNDLIGWMPRFLDAIGTIAYGLVYHAEIGLGFMTWS